MIHCIFPGRDNFGCVMHLQFCGRRMGNLVDLPPPWTKPTALVQPALRPVALCCISSRSLASHFLSDHFQKKPLQPKSLFFLFFLRKKQFFTFSAHWVVEWGEGAMFLQSVFTVNSLFFLYAEEKKKKSIHKGLIIFVLNCSNKTL